MRYKKLQSGYALLTSIVLTGTLVLIAYAVSNISLRQLALVTTTTESHGAFYIADSGLECAIFWDLKNPNNPTKSAFDPTSPASSVTCGNTTSTLTNTTSGSSVNVALGKSTSQVSTFDGITVSSNAVDGNTNGNYSSGSITHTSSTLTPNPWWQVDLGSSVAINSIVLWNRTDCCMSRLNDYWVFVSDTPFGPSDTPSTLQSRSGTWSSHQTSYPNPSSSLSVGGFSGRYVRVQLSGTDYLSLAEVQIFNIGAGGTSTFQIPVGSSCANVLVTKSGTDTTIESRGYNTCSVGTRFERAVRRQC
ncbi:MAG: galactose-binding domain-containing protein [Minisyncoccota bacterium]